MQAVEEIPVPANDHVTLEPGGYHIMLMMVQQVPEVGSTFELELEFKNAGVMTIPVEVRAFE
jgi:copper(I)-binding protein